MGDAVVAEIRELPPDLAPLVGTSAAEGFQFLQRLVRDWRSGANRFEAPGEVLLEVRRDGRLVGIGGLNCDPYARVASIGRVRHVYVAPGSRRLGMGSRLVVEILARARGRFAAVRLRTSTREAELFYRALGFAPTVGDPEATHAIRLCTSPGRPSPGIPLPR